jgi:transposase-like protein
MRSSDPRTDPGTRSDPADVPSACPACQSRAITTTAKSPDSSAYWRCRTCGEIWNVSRRESRRTGANPWR